MKKEGEEILELKHEAKPGYRTVFYIVLLLACIYLGFIFYSG